MPDVEPIPAGYNSITPYLIVDDAAAALVRDAGWTGSGVINYYHADDPMDGLYCIYWTDADQYNTIGWKFSPIRDFSTLLSEDFRLVFWMKADAGSTCSGTHVMIGRDDPITTMNWWVGCTSFTGKPAFYLTDSNSVGALASPSMATSINNGSSQAA